MIVPIVTKSLILRPLELQDAVDLHSLETDPAVKKFLNGASNYDLDHYKQWIAKVDEYSTILAVTFRNDGRFIGGSPNSL